ncbi:uncharacterized protein K444DRAFT_338831 [Hyaloscypha bicolor E]|uniref:Uncharacterized protein n=1 Tax=Hyaloscypha bicolor E TaxID=1095630 RepID=A0A2J6TH22_9HELO|nr:uncharacterized protein K444DRAFT_338831 [Hyaloscypha bicolor E]PMD62294.1 hypothetical protein K444DRAFT_338831 [Hyaloscypha bicolor E]
MLPTSRRFNACLPSLATDVLGGSGCQLPGESPGLSQLADFLLGTTGGLPPMNVALSELGAAAKAPEADDRDSNPERHTILSQFSHAILPQLVLQKNSPPLWKSPKEVKLPYLPQSDLSTSRYSIFHVNFKV